MHAVFLVANTNMPNYSSLCFFFLLLLPLLVASASSEDLQTCLISHAVRNFTFSHHPTYLHLFHSTLQNLRFVNSLFQKPVAVIYPQNKQQLAAVVRCSRRGSWAIRVRGGGHSFEGLSSYADAPFLLIDLMNLNRIKVDVESETAWVEGGTTLGEIYHAVTKASSLHAIPGGMCVTVGSGGHISGGGYGALARKYGLAADNVVDAILVDSKGRILSRKSMGEDVFWAIRGGGGGNFGVVAAWKINIVRVPKTVTAFRAIRIGNTTEMAHLWHKWQVAAPSLEDEFFLQVVIFPSKPLNIIMGFLGMYLGPKSSALSSIKAAFPELSITDQECNLMNWAEAFIFLRGDPNVNHFSDLPNRFSYHKKFTKSKADFVKAPIPKPALEGALEMVAKQETPAGWLLLDPYGGVLGRTPRDATPFPHRAGTLYAIEYFVEWEDSREGYLDWIREIYEYMSPHVAKDPRTVYVNNVDLDLGVMEWRNLSMGGGGKGVEVARQWGEKYFLGNFDRLVRAKTRIDPENVFRHPQSIPPLLFESDGQIEIQMQKQHSGVQFF